MPRPALFPSDADRCQATSPDALKGPHHRVTPLLSPREVEARAVLLDPSLSGPGPVAPSGSALAAMGAPRTRQNRWHVRLASSLSLLTVLGTAVGLSIGPVSPLANTLLQPSRAQAAAARPRVVMLPVAAPPGAEAMGLAMTRVSVQRLSSAVDVIEVRAGSATDGQTEADCIFDAACVDKLLAVTRADAVVTGIVELAPPASGRVDQLLLVIMAPRWPVSYVERRVKLGDDAVAAQLRELLTVSNGSVMPESAAKGAKETINLPVYTPAASASAGASAGTTSGASTGTGNSAAGASGREPAAGDDDVPVLPPISVASRPAKSAPPTETSPMATAPASPVTDVAAGSITAADKAPDKSADKASDQSADKTSDKPSEKKSSKGKSSKKASEKAAAEKAAAEKAAADKAAADKAALEKAEAEAAEALAAQEAAAQKVRDDAAAEAARQEVEREAAALDANQGKNGKGKKAGNKKKSDKGGKKNAVSDDLESVPSDPDLESLTTDARTLPPSKPRPRKETKGGVGRETALDRLGEPRYAAELSWPARSPSGPWNGLTIEGQLGGSYGGTNININSQLAIDGSNVIAGQYRWVVRENSPAFSFNLGVGYSVLDMLEVGLQVTGMTAGKKVALSTYYPDPIPDYKTGQTTSGMHVLAGLRVRYFPVPHPVVRPFLGLGAGLWNMPGYQPFDPLAGPHSLVSSYQRFYLEPAGGVRILVLPRGYFLLEGSLLVDPGAAYLEKDLDADDAIPVNELVVPPAAARSVGSFHLGFGFLL